MSSFREESHEVNLYDILNQRNYKRGPRKVLHKGTQESK